MTRIGVVGAGFMGANHTRLLATEVTGAMPVAIADVDFARATELAERHGLRALASAEDLIADAEVDAVLIASPDPSHEPLALAAISAGKPALVEKPLATDAAGCQRIVEAELAAGCRLVQVAYMRRYDPGYVAMKATLTSGRLGAPLFLHCIHRNATAPHFITSESVLTNAVVHEIDVGRFLLDAEFTAVSVVSPRASTRLAQFVILESERGVVMDVEAFLDAQYGYDVRAELVCDEGTISLQPNPPVSVRQAGRDGYDVAPIWTRRFEAAYVGLLRDWIAHAGAGTAGGSNAWDGFAATVTADAALVAWQSSSRETVAIPARPTLYDDGSTIFAGLGRNSA